MAEIYFDCRLHEMTWNTFGRRRVPRHPGRLYVEKHGYGDNWYRQRERVLKRDNFTCQKCGHKGVKKGRTWDVDVHHIRKIALFYDSRTGILDYERANDLSNLITLCRKSCHPVADGHRQMKGFISLK